MRLTADKLELFDKPGKGRAANAISAAVTTGTREAIRKIGRRYNRDRAVAALTSAFTTIYHVMLDYADLGACDTEPRAAVKSELVNRLAKRYDLSQWENDELYYAL